MDCSYLTKLTFKGCNKFKTLSSVKITLHLLQNKTHQLCKLLSKIEPIKSFFLFCKNSCFRSKKFWCVKKPLIFLTCPRPKVNKMTAHFFYLFEVSRISIKFLTCPKSVRWLFWLAQSKQNDHQILWIVQSQQNNYYFFDLFKASRQPSKK